MFVCVKFVLRIDLIYFTLLKFIYCVCCVMLCFVRVFWRSKFGTELQVSLSQLIEAFCLESGLSSCDWGGPEDDADKLIVTSGVVDTPKAQMTTKIYHTENILLHRFLSMKWGVVDSTKGSSDNGTLFAGIPIKLNQFVKLVGVTGEKNFVPEMTKEIEAIRDLFVSRIKFKVLRSISGMSLLLLLLLVLF